MISAQNWPKTTKSSWRYPYTPNTVRLFPICWYCTLIHRQYCKTHHVDRFLLPSSSRHSCSRQQRTGGDSWELSLLHGPQRHLGRTKVTFNVNCQVPAILICISARDWILLEASSRASFGHPTQADFPNLRRPAPLIHLPVMISANVSWP